MNFEKCNRKYSSWAFAIDGDEEAPKWYFSKPLPTHPMLTEFFALQTLPSFQRFRNRFKNPYFPI